MKFGRPECFAERDDVVPRFLFVSAYRRTKEDESRSTESRSVVILKLL